MLFVEDSGFRRLQSPDDAFHGRFRILEHSVFRKPFSLKILDSEGFSLQMTLFVEDSEFRRFLASEDHSHKRFWILDSDFRFWIVNSEFWSFMYSEAHTEILEFRWHNLITFRFRIQNSVTNSESFKYDFWIQKSWISFFSTSTMSLQLYPLNRYLLYHPLITLSFSEKSSCLVDAPISKSVCSDHATCSPQLVALFRHHLPVAKRNGRCIW